MATEPTDQSLERTYLYHQLDEYPWSEDEEFQGGLRAILGSVQDPAQVEHLTLRAKCYYYSRKAGTPVDFDGYKQWVETLRTEAPAVDGANDITTTHEALHDSRVEVTRSRANTASLADPPKPATFAEICEMIAEGKPIPGIKEIPDTILDGQATESQASTRRKPWESGQIAVAEKPSWMP